MGRRTDAKERLLQATIDLVWSHSYGSVGVEQICERAGVKKGSFYHFFPSKVQLVAAALDHHWQCVRPDIDRIFSPSVPPLQRLADYLEFAYQRLATQKERFGQVLGCPYAALGSEVSQLEDERPILEHVQQAMTRWQCYLHAIVRDAMDLGLIPNGDADATSQRLFHFIQGVLSQARVQNDPEVMHMMTPCAFSVIGISPERIPTPQQEHAAL